METLDAIRTRRSIRKFKPEAVEAQVVKELLEAAMSAPSAGNAQPWHFIVITHRRILDQAREINPYAPTAGAPLGILVCADLSLERFAGYWVQDCAAATQNLLLAAHDKGLGAVWTGIHPMADRVEKFKKLLNLPPSVVPLSLVVLGPPAQTLKGEDRYREDRVHQNTW